MGYHLREIPKGVFGEASKIMEEAYEFEEALEQNNPVMALVELSDLIGAIDEYATRNYNIGLDALIAMAEATRRAFEDGSRKSADDTEKGSDGSISYITGTLDRSGTVSGIN